MRRKVAGLAPYLFFSDSANADNLGVFFCPRGIQKFLLTAILEKYRGWSRARHIFPGIEPCLAA